jgi:hypothetical protein
MNTKLRNKNTTENKLQNKVIIVNSKSFNINKMILRDMYSRNQ